jgi:hypothetical protein
MDCAGTRSFAERPASLEESDFVKAHIVTQNVPKYSKGNQTLDIERTWRGGTAHVYDIRIIISIVKRSSKRRAETKIEVIVQRIFLDVCDACWKLIVIND